MWGGHEFRCTINSVEWTGSKCSDVDLRVTCLENPPCSKLSAKHDAMHESPLPGVCQPEAVTRWWWVSGQQHTV